MPTDLANNSGTRRCEPEMVRGANLFAEGEADWICAGILGCLRLGLWQQLWLLAVLR
jgi:hypothetical protein